LLETVPLDTSRSFLGKSLEISRSKHLPTIRAYYADIAKSCLMIVGNRSVDIETAGKDISLLSFVVNLEDVFEKYARNVIRDFFRRCGSDLGVGNGNRESRGRLFFDNPNIPVKPDIVVGDTRAPKLVADVKYKPRVSEVDRYQTISHAASYGTKKAMLVLPAFEEPSGLTRTGQVRDASGIEFYEYRYRLDSSLEEEEARLGREILSLATT
jgi:5-methylcytosine-specific restriction endonuclease McrBC regulatory subunit McrC